MHLTPICEQVGKNGIKSFSLPGKTATMVFRAWKQRILTGSGGERDPEGEVLLGRYKK
jgi:hypothetical protein